MVWVGGGVGGGGWKGWRFFGVFFWGGFLLAFHPGVGGRRFVGKKEK